MNIRLALCAAFLGLAAPAQADWYEASSEHFVIYADDGEKDIREFATNLERYHSAMEFITGRQSETPSPSNRLTIFAVGNSNTMRKLSGDSMVAGFYVPRAGAARAFVQNIRNRSGSYPDFSVVVLLHEYAHHYMMSTTPYAMPRWLSEGGAEFFASTSFESDGSVKIGRPAQHRAGDLAYAERVKLDALLDADIYEKTRGRQYDQFYARSWLLYHYLAFEESRKGQLQDYLVRVAKGEKSIQAAEAAFGKLDDLQRDLDRYLRQRRMMTFLLPPDRIKVSRIDLRRLPEGEAKMMDLRIVSQRGVGREEALELVTDARAIASKYPDDPGVLIALAEAEFDAGYSDAAIAAADRALALDPRQVNAYVQKGYALFRKAEESGEKGAFNAAIAPFTALNKIENDHPLPLIYYYRKFIEEGAEPTENARHALERASQIAPFDQPLALNAALMLAGEGKIALARSKLHPLTSNPHGGTLSEVAAKYHAALEAVEEGTLWQPNAEDVGKAQIIEARDPAATD